MYKFREVHVSLTNNRSVTALRYLNYSVRFAYYSAVLIQKETASTLQLNWQRIQSAIREIRMNPSIIKEIIIARNYHEIKIYNFAIHRIDCYFEWIN